MDFKQITELVKLVKKSNLSELKLKDGNFELSIRTSSFSKEKSSGAKSEIPQIVSLGSHAPVQAAPATPTTQPQSPSPQAEEVPAEEAPSQTTEYLEIRSPMVGTFYRSSSPDKPPYVKVGDTIEEGSVVCIIEAMKLFNEIESEISGKIAKVMVEDAAPVEYDQVLFLIEPV